MWTSNKFSISLKARSLLGKLLLIPIRDMRGGKFRTRICTWQDPCERIQILFVSPLDVKTTPVGVVIWRSGQKLFQTFHYGTVNEHRATSKPVHKKLKYKLLITVYTLACNEVHMIKQPDLLGQSQLSTIRLDFVADILNYPHARQDSRGQALTGGKTPRFYILQTPNDLVILPRKARYRLVKTATRIRYHNY